MGRYRFTLEDFVTEVKTGDTYFVLGTPQNCTISSSKQNINTKAYVIANRAGTTRIIPQDEFENGEFILRKEN